MKWQRPTSWSRETTNGRLYIERNMTGQWVVYVRGKKVSIEENESDAKKVATAFGRDGSG